MYGRGLTLSVTAPQAALLHRRLRIELGSDTQNRYSLTATGITPGLRFAYGSDLSCTMEILDDESTALVAKAAH
jgi:hypothetical protein